VVHAACLALSIGNKIMRIVIAIGGNALLKKGEEQNAQTLKRNCDIAAKDIAKLAQEHEIIIVHGNGPQVGMLALQSDFPFDVLDAESQGMIGYLLQQSLDNALDGKKAISVLTQVEVDANDPAFKHPSKPIGPYYDAAEKSKLEQAHGWHFVQRDQSFRRIVPSPKPKSIIELEAIKLLTRSNHIVIAAGGGGIPCAKSDHGLIGIEAVIDKDLSACRLALDLNADKLIILTDVDGVYQGWGSKERILVKDSQPNTLMAETFESGSMGPKIQAACQFVISSGNPSIIGHLEKLSAIMDNQSGTTIRL
jgi:carbamate kinase